jgi:arsenate reductase (glutaredoxin)
MKIPRNQVILYYDPETSIGKQTYAYAKSIAKHVQAIEFTKANLTNRIWQDILEMLNLRAKDLLDRSNPVYQEKLKGISFEQEDWLNVIVKNPELIKAPILIKGSKAILCITPSDVLKMTD